MPIHDKNVRHRRPLPAAQPLRLATAIVDVPGVVDLLRLQAMQQVVATVIHAARLKADLSQDEVAVRLGWIRTAYAQRELGERRISVPEFFVIAPALNLTAAHLMSKVLALDLHGPSIDVAAADRATLVKRAGRIRTWQQLQSLNSKARASTAVTVSVDRLKHATALVIGACRRDAGLTQEGCVGPLGWPRDMLAKIERELRNLYIHEFIFLAPALKMTPEQLLIKIERW